MDPSVGIACKTDGSCCGAASPCCTEYIGDDEMRRLGLVPGVSTNEELAAVRETLAAKGEAPD